MRLPYLPTERRLFCREKHVVLRQISPCICMEGIDAQIIKGESKCGRGAIVFPVNFVSRREGRSALKTLERLTTKAHSFALLEESIVT